MAVSNTLDALKNKLQLEIVDTMNNRLKEAIENVTQVSPNGNNVLTLNPNLSTLFKASLSSDTTVSITNPTSLYTTNGSTFALFLALSSESIQITWPLSVKWQNEETPTFGSVNVVTFITFDSGTSWYASCLVGSSDF